MGEKQQQPETKPDIKPDTEKTKSNISDEQTKIIKDLCKKHDVKPKDIMNFMKTFDEYKGYFDKDGLIDKVGAMFVENEFASIYDRYCVENKLA